MYTLFLDGILSRPLTCSEIFVVNNFQSYLNRRKNIIDQILQRYFNNLLNIIVQNLRKISEIYSTPAFVIVRKKNYFH